MPAWRGWRRSATSSRQQRDADSQLFKQPQVVFADRPQRLPQLVLRAVISWPGQAPPHQDLLHVTLASAAWPDRLGWK
jgi:hypothetical protein